MNRKWNTPTRKLTNLLVLFGPAWLVMMADMDASSTIGAAETGAVLKYSLVWFLLLLTIPLYFIQEVSGRIGIATGKGLGEIIRERYSRKVSLAMALPMALTDVLTYAVEYAGAAVGLAVFGIPVIVSVPIIFTAHLLLMLGRKYEQAERVLLFISPILFVGFALVLVESGIKPYPLFYFSLSPSFVFLLAANVGAVVMPFMLFFQASATAIKYSTRRFVPKRVAINRIRMETAVGALATELLMVLVEMSMAGADPSTNFLSPQSISKALSSFAGPLSPIFFGVGLVAAAFLALVVISLGSAWGVVEALGVGREKTFIVYILESVPAALAISLVPTQELANAVLNLLVFLVLALVGPGVIQGLISSDEKVMGDLKNTRPQSLLYWASLAFVLVFGFLAIF
ncbi:NRAMP family divalent metal transporter [Metallosphaera sedula]|uniref:NRAMP family divalent metal transporter n=1 Tax=Metallosphaera sedula TaxID=43687 RepID=UPI0020C0701B|nr:NRAMP family divalent metal transporter [Metallosphaera sedula]BBL46448.1 divalent metal cation transporter MntH [Metallosphaera sedula]